MAENSEFPPLGFTVLKRKPNKPVATTTTTTIASPQTVTTIYTNPFKQQQQNTYNTDNTDNQSFTEPQHNTSSYDSVLSDLPSQKEVQDNIPLNTYNLQNYHPFFESQPSIKIMARKQPNSDNKQVKQVKQTKSLEEKEMDYQKSRAAIFGTDIPTTSTTSPSTTTTTTNTTILPPITTTKASTSFENNNNYASYKPGNNKNKINSNENSPNSGVRQPKGPDPSQGNGFNRNKNNPSMNDKIKK